MERLTCRIDDGAELDEIAFINPQDPEGMYNLRDIVEYSSDEQIYKIANRLCSYEDTGLSPDEIPHWIPVSERLPKESEYREKDTGELIPLLVCVKGTKYPFRAMYDGKTWGDGIDKIEVTHWMPLPQPPKGEK